MRLTVYAWFVVFLTATVAMKSNSALAESNPDRLLARQADAIEAVGVVRYFHPHDAVTVVDWNSVLLEGFRLAETAGDDATFSESLAGMLGQIGSGITQVDKDPAGTAAGPSVCDSGEPPVRWVHEGIGAPPALGRRGPYISQRTGIDEQQTDESSYAVVMMRVDAEPWIGEKLLFEGELRMPRGGEGVLWIRVDDAEDNPLAFNNMNDRRYDRPEWTSRGLIFPVEHGAESIFMGMVVYGTVPGEFRNVTLKVYDEGSEQPVGESLLPDAEDWGFNTHPDVYDMRSERSDDGVSVSIESEATQYETPSSVLAAFEDAPVHGTVELPDGSRLQVPMALCGERVGLSESERERLAERFGRAGTDDLSAAELARLDVATLWPVVQHFYPYRENLDDWPAALESALEASRSVEDRKEHRRRLQKLTVHLNDGHTRVHETEPGQREEVAWLPMSVLALEKGLVVGSTGSPDSVAVGDRITSIDGQPVRQWLERVRGRYSGSSQWRTHRAIQRLLRGVPGDTRVLGLERSGETLETRLPFEREQPLEAHSHPPTRELADGIVHVDLTNVSEKQWEELLPGLIEASGIVFDLRGYPGGAGSKFLGHMLESRDDFTGWMNVMAARAPDGDLITAREREWAEEPVEPHIDTPAVFLTDHRAISYAESLIGQVKHHELGTVVGSNTAGANGNVLPLQLPGGFTVSYTGMFVVGPDGEPFHGRGIEPHVRVVPTVEGLREERDELLERALEVLQER